MEPVTFNKKQVIRYLIWTFGIAWAIQAGVYVLYEFHLEMIGTVVMTVMMFAPMLGVLLCGRGFRGLGWKPRIKKNIGRILLAWFMPAVLTALGAALYFLIFPAHFDITGAAMAAQYGDEVIEQLASQGVSYPLYILISVIACVTYAPVINTFVSLGEEVGWRGFLYPQLKARFGKTTGRLLGGVIWGVWHWPIIWLIGYEYGYDYFGFPITGMLTFLMFTTAVGFLEDWIYTLSESIWLPSLLHGTINAAATIPLLLCFTGSDAYRLLGPIPNGWIAALPMIIAAVIAAVWEAKKDKTK